MKYVQHNTWFYTNIGDTEYRGIYLTHGFSYATLRIDKQVTYREKKWIFFGEMVEKTKWETIIHNSREDFSRDTTPMPKPGRYPVTITKALVEELIELSVHQHTERI